MWCFFFKLEIQLNPVLVGGDLAGVNIIKVAIGSFHACAVSQDGRLFCWGTNVSGTLGIGELGTILQLLIT